MTFRSEELFLTIDLRSQFDVTDKANKESSCCKKKPKLTLDIIQDGTNNTSETEVHFTKQETKQQVARNNYENVATKVQQELRSYTVILETKSAIKQFF